MIDECRLVELALRLAPTPSFTGSEQAAAELVRDVFAEDLARSAVAAGRGRPANVVGTWAGDRGGPTLMFNGHLDTSYSGREPWLHGIPGFQPEGFERVTGASTGLGSRT